MTMTQPSRPPMYGPPPREPERPRYEEVNHILHLLLTIVTFGFWALVWFLMGVNAYKNNQAIHKQYVRDLKDYEDRYIKWQFGSDGPLPGGS